MDAASDGLAPNPPEQSPVYLGTPMGLRSDGVASCHEELMAKQRIQFGFDFDSVWERVRGRRSIFLDSNCWIAMADEVGPVASRIRARLQSLVRSGEVFCPLSWGILEELFKQSGPSLAITAGLMEELSLNAVFVM